MVKEVSSQFIMSSNQTNSADYFTLAAASMFQSRLNESSANSLSQFISVDSYTFKRVNVFIKGYSSDDGKAELINALSPNYVSDLGKVSRNEMTWDNIFGKYGTHLSVSANVGASLYSCFSVYSETVQLSSENFIVLKDLLKTSPKQATVLKNSINLSDLINYGFTDNNTSRDLVIRTFGGNSFGFVEPEEIKKSFSD